MRIACTIAETAPNVWAVLACGADIDGQKQLVQSLPPGENRVLILSTSGVLRRDRREVVIDAAKKRKAS